MRYAVVIEKAGSNYSAYVPDLPGCVATGSTIAETEASIREAIEFHIDGLREDGETVPVPSAITDYVEVAPAIVATGAIAPKKRRLGGARSRSKAFAQKTEHWTKRDAGTGKFMDRKADKKPFKGVRKEK